MSLKNNAKLLLMNIIIATGFLFYFRATEKWEFIIGLVLGPVLMGFYTKGLSDKANKKQK